MALWGADAEELMPEGWEGGGDGVAAVGGNYGFLSFPVGFRDVYARVEYKRRRLAGSSLGRTGRRRQLLRQASLRNTNGIYPFRLRGWFGGEFTAYFVNIIKFCYRGMEEGWKDGRIEGMHGIICCHSTLSALSYEQWKIIRQPHYHNTGGGVAKLLL